MTVTLGIMLSGCQTVVACLYYRGWHCTRIVLGTCPTGWHREGDRQVRWLLAQVPLYNNVERQSNKHTFLIDPRAPARGGDTLNSSGTAFVHKNSFVNSEMKLTYY